MEKEHDHHTSDKKHETLTIEKASQPKSLISNRCLKSYPKKNLNTNCFKKSASGSRHNYCTKSSTHIECNGQNCSCYETSKNMECNHEIIKKDEYHEHDKQSKQILQFSRKDNSIYFEYPSSHQRAFSNKERQKIEDKIVYPSQQRIFDFNAAMDPEKFRKYGKEMVDYIADYWGRLRNREGTAYPSSDIQPGYLSSSDLLPSEAPTESESLEKVLEDVTNIIMPSTTHWNHPNFFAYFPTGISYPSLCGDMLSGAIGCVGFTWPASPACTELEMVMMDWLAKAMDLPKEFMFSSKAFQGLMNADHRSMQENMINPGKGGGIIMSKASEATIVGFLAARNRKLMNLREKKKHESIIIKGDEECSSNYLPHHINAEDFENISKLVAYTSDQAHPSVERGALLAMIRIVKISTDPNELVMDGNRLRKRIIKDKENGLIPFFVCATLGTTATCSYDDLYSVGEVCREFDLWLHVDAAYAGCAFICPEYRHYLKGIEFVDSYDFNPHKWLLVNFDSSCVWFRDATHVVNAFDVESVYLKHAAQGIIPDLRHWQIPFGSRFRALKIWFTLRMHGIQKIQEYIRRAIALAKDFELLVESDPRFEIYFKVTLGLVCFRLKEENNENVKTRELYRRIRKDNRIHLVPGEAHGTFFIRFAICSTLVEHRDIRFAWSIITELADKMLAKEEYNVSSSNEEILVHDVKSIVQNGPQ